MRLLVLCFCLAAAACSPNQGSVSLASAIADRMIVVGPFGSSEMSVDGQQVMSRRIDGGDTDAAGVMLSQASGGWDKRWLVRFRAESDGPFSILVLSADQSLRQIIPQIAMDGRAAEFVLSNETPRLIVYSDTADRVSLTVDEIIDCDARNAGACMDSLAFHNTVFPDGAPSNRREMLLSLLDWASNNADYAASANVHAWTMPYVGALTATELYASLYADDQGGGYCGAHAAFLAKLLRDYGFDAVTVDYGILSARLTHVTTIVLDPFGDGQAYILDPTFNMIAETDGRWASLNEVMDTRASIALNSRPMPERDFLAANIAEASDVRLTDCEPRTRAADGWRYLSCKGENFGLDSYLRGHAREFRAADIEPTHEGFLWLLRNAEYYRVSGGSDEARATVQAILSR